MNYKENWEKTKKENFTLDEKTDLRIWKGIRRRISEEKKAKTPKWYWAAASISLFALVGMFALNSFGGNLFHLVPESEKTLVYQAGEISKRVVLEDGSVIVLEPGSQLTLSPSFGKELRSVSFTGRGYFEIAKDAEKPFEVAGADFQVSVLGTKFNLTSNGGDKQVDLLEGKVRVTTQNDALILNPQESWTWKDKKSYHYFSVSRSRTFMFENTDYKQVISEIEATYNVQIAYPSTLQNKTLTGSLSGNLDELLTQVSFPFNLKLNKKSNLNYELN